MLQFEIIERVSERKPEGNTLYYFKVIGSKDNVGLHVNIKNRDADDKDYVRKRMMETYNAYLSSQEKAEDGIKVGDVI